MKQRRVSTSALPILMEASLQKPEWAFRDEMGLSSSRSPSISSLTPLRRSSDRTTGGVVPKKSKLRRVIKNGSEGDADVLYHAGASAGNNPAAKRPRRNMWTEEETQNLVDGCNEVRIVYVFGVGATLTPSFF